MSCRAFLAETRVTVKGLAKDGAGRTRRRACRSSRCSGLEHVVQTEPTLPIVHRSYPLFCDHIPEKFRHGNISVGHLSRAVNQHERTAEAAVLNEQRCDQGHRRHLRRWEFALFTDGRGCADVESAAFATGATRIVDAVASGANRMFSHRKSSMSAPAPEDEKLLLVDSSATRIQIALERIPLA